MVPRIEYGAATNSGGICGGRILGSRERDGYTFGPTAGSTS